MKSPESPFLFVVCQIGAEAVLKEELTRSHPELRFSYSRPGFLTFKQVEEKPIPADVELKSVFTRAYGLSFGKASADEIVSRIRALGEIQPVRLHVWARDPHPVGEEPPKYVAKNLEVPAEAKIRLGGGDRILPGTVAQDGELVVDVVLVEDEEWWWGVHQHTAFHSPHPGGKTPLTLPDEAPSRAYLKLNESILWSHAPVKAGDTAVEIGSAPGGASYALLERGVNVVGIDPGEMHPNVMKFVRKEAPWFEHIQRPIAAVRREDFPPKVDWLLLDMNVTPGISLYAVDRLAVAMKDCLQGVLLTLKLNQWSIADEIPEMIEHVRSMGMVKVRVAQLSNNKQEITVVGFTSKKGR